MLVFKDVAFHTVSYRRVAAEARSVAGSPRPLAPVAVGGPGASPQLAGRPQMPLAGAGAGFWLLSPAQREFLGLVAVSGWLKRRFSGTGPRVCLLMGG